MTVFLNEVGGYTPLIDSLVREVDLMGAAVYGVVWRYCQMQEGVCKKPAQGIAQCLGLSERTVRDRLKRLVRLGYLGKTRGSPNHYVVTDKAKERLKIGPKSAHDDPAADAEPVDKSGESCQSVRQELPAPPAVDSGESGKRCQQVRHLMPATPAGAADKESLYKTHKETLYVGADAPHPKKTDHQEMFEVLARCCGWELGLLSQKRRGQLNRISKQLREQAITVGEVEAWLGLWYGHDWRGKRGQPPDNPQLIVDNWSRYRSRTETGGKGFAEASYEVPVMYDRWGNEL